MRRFVLCIVGGEENSIVDYSITKLAIIATKKKALKFEVDCPINLAKEP